MREIHIAMRDNDFDLICICDAVARALFRDAKKENKSDHVCTRQRQIERFMRRDAISCNVYV